MVSVSYETAEGMIALEGKSGQSVMDVAVRSGVPGIVGECGGTITCATCHVYVDSEYVDQAGSMSDLEDEMLEEVFEPRLPTSRLSCQITLSDAIDGLIVRVPEEEI